MQRDLEEADMTPSQRSFVTSFVDGNRRLVKSNRTFFLKLAFLYPDKLIHALTKLIRPSYAPHLISRIRMRALLRGKERSIPLERVASPPLEASVNGEGAHRRSPVLVKRGRRPRRPHARPSRAVGLPLAWVSPGGEVQLPDHR